MDRPTVEAYERHGAEWVAARAANAGSVRPALVDFARRCRDHDAAAPVLDLGCGPAWHTVDLGPGAIGGDAAASMLAAARSRAVTLPLVRLDAEALPVRTGALAGVWARNCLQHVPAERLPQVLAELHRVLTPGAPLRCNVTDTSLHDRFADPYGARHFARWDVDHVRLVLEGGGFGVERCVRVGEWIEVDATRAHTLADAVGPEMQLLLVGINPSPYSATAGVGFARPGNRFWPAALAAGIVSVDRDAQHALHRHAVGHTDLVKRPTARADQLDADELRAGIERVRMLCAWLRPAAVCFVGLSGYRVTVDRRAVAGWQSEPFGGVPAYVMPNSSGLNAHTNVAELAAHLRAAYDGPP